MEDDKVAIGESDPSEYNEVVTTKDTKTIDAFLSHIIHVRMGMAHTGEGINVMTLALHTQDGSLPQGLTVQNAYTELHSGSKKVAVVVRNSMAYPQTLRQKTPVVRAVVPCECQSHLYKMVWWRHWTKPEASKCPNWL